MGREAKLASLVVEHFEEAGWDVFQEVTFGGPVADIVVTRKSREGAPLIGVIECKTSLSLDLIGQAVHWTKYANWVWAAYPMSRASEHGFGATVLRHYGIGTVPVGHSEVTKGAPPTFRRKIDKRLFDTLRPEHQSGFAKAGSNAGGHYTPFKGTCLQLCRLVESSPGITLKEAIRKMTHHYSRDSVAAACLAKYLKSGVIQGVMERHEGGKTLLFPARHEV